MTDTVKEQIINAIQNNDFETVETFIDNGNITLASCLFKFMVLKNLEGLKYIVDNKEGINVKYDDLNILSIACQLNWIDGVEFLLQFDTLKKDMTQQSKFLYTPLYTSIVYEKEDVIRHILENHKDLIVELIPQYNDTIIHTAISVGNKDIFKLLLNNLSDDEKHILNIKNSKGWTPLHLAVLSNDIEIVQLLIEHGTDVNIMDKTSKTPLELAFDNNSTHIFEYLKEKTGDNYFESIQLS